MRFTKMHGAGNDYVYVNCFQEQLPADLPALARAVSDRHFGVGGDGLILIRPSETADVRMQMFNADGSEAEMCGNGIRCVAKYAYDHDIARDEQMKIETAAGVLAVELTVEDGVARQVRVNMGEPILAADKIPTLLKGDPIVDREVVVAGRSISVTCISMGNPHCVVYVDDLSDDWVLGIGPRIETGEWFPNKVNVEFVKIHGPGEVSQRTWERGSGETLACGTGASAVCVAGVLTGRTERKIVNHLLGGDLELEWAENNHVYMTGPAMEVFSGEWQSQTAASIH